MFLLEGHPIIKMFLAYRFMIFLERRRPLIELLEAMRQNNGKRNGNHVRRRPSPLMVI